jgi:hypothetical protein
MEVVAIEPTIPWDEADLSEQPPRKKTTDKLCDNKPAS